MATLRYQVIDVFTESALNGNPLAVFSEAGNLDVETMQALARELNLSETTFVSPPTRGGSARVRIFTPRQEIPFAGHPTLGTAVVLAQSSGVSAVTLELGVGLVPVVFEPPTDLGLRCGWFRRPSPGPVEQSHTRELIAALGLRESIGVPTVYDNGMLHGVVQVANYQELANLRPNFAALAGMPVDTIDVFSVEEAEAHLRVFAPAHGIPEDPATGSAAAPLFEYLVAQGQLPRNATLSIRQGDFVQRPSRILVRRAETDERETPLIEVGGTAVIVAGGEFNLPNLSLP